jgi:signal transduction histidine kinase
VSPDQRALVERPPTREQIRAAIAIGLLLIASGIPISSIGEMPLREFPAFIPVVDAMLLVSDLVIAILLFAQASVFRSRAFMTLAAGYVFTAPMAVAHALTFPGAFAPTGLLSPGLSSTAWLAVFWRGGFALSASAYAVLKSKTSRVSRPSIEIIASVTGAFAIAAILSTLAIRGSDLLPPLVVVPRIWYYPAFFPVNATMVALFLVAIATLLWQRKSRLDVWLLLSLSAWLVHQLLIISSPGRFTLAWYFAFVLALISHVIVMLAVIAEASQAYARLSLTVSAWNRDRDARLMSLDAVIAAIAHEVRQPLAAMVTNASAGLRWLDRTPPNLEMVGQSLRWNIDLGHRASDLIASLRSVLANRPDEQSKFSLNELVRETAPMLGRELTRDKISLQLRLDDTLPPIFADRVQVQQVLVNLFTNAIHSLRATRGRTRCIVIRSVRLDGQDVLLDVSDNGIGIPSETMEQIFDVFFTTKANGTGIGLSLCRTIIEKHGGHLWASHGEQHGATFHVQLPAVSD